MSKGGGGACVWCALARARAVACRCIDTYVRRRKTATPAPPGRCPCSSYTTFVQTGKRMLSEPRSVALESGCSD